MASLPVTMSTSISASLKPDAFTSRAIQATKDLIEQLSLEVFEEAIINVPYLTGELEGSIRRTTWEQGEEIGFEVGSDVEYAKYTELTSYVYYKNLGPLSKIKGARMPWLQPAFEKVLVNIEHRLGSKAAAALSGRELSEFELPTEGLGEDFVRF